MPESSTNLKAHAGSAWHVNADQIMKDIGYASGAGSPQASVTPDYIGQIYFDTSGAAFYIATTTANTGWSTLGIAGLSPTELAFIDGVTPGTVAASKAMVTDANSQIDVLSIASGGTIFVSSTGKFGLGVTAQSVLRASASLSATLSLFATTGASYVAQTSATVSGVFGFTSTMVTQLFNALLEFRAVLSNYGLSKGGA